MIKIITLITLVLSIPACEVNHHHGEEPYTYETVYYEPEPIVYTTEYVEVVYDDYTMQPWYPCYSSELASHADQLIYCDPATACCVYAVYNCEVTYCYDYDTCEWYNALELCYY